MKRIVKKLSFALVVVMLVSIIAPFTASANVNITNINLSFNFEAGGYEDFNVPAGTHMETGIVYYECSDGTTSYTLRPESGKQYTIFAEIKPQQGYSFSSESFSSFVFNGVSFTKYTGGGAVPAGSYKVSDNSVVFRAKFSELTVVDDKGAALGSKYLFGFHIKGEVIPFTGFDACNDSRHLSALSVTKGDAALKKYTNAVDNEATMGASASTITASFVYNHNIYREVLKKSAIGKEGEFVYACYDCLFQDPEGSRVLPFVDYEYEGFNDGVCESKTLYYNGKTQHLGLQLSFNGVPLKSSEYYYEYPAESVKVGRYIAKVYVFSEYFYDEMEYDYNIYFGKPQVKAKVGVNSVSLSWKKVPGATGYRVYGYNLKTGKYSKIIDTKSLSYTRKGRTAGTAYAYLVRAYGKNKDGKVVFSPYSKSDNVKVVTLCAAPKPSASVSGKTVTLKWAKVANVKYYRVYKYNAKTKKYTTLVKSTTKLSVKLSKQPKGTNYYLVRAFNKANVGSAYTTKNLKKVVVR